MSKEIIKSAINEVDPEMFLGIPDETIDIMISKALNSEKVYFEAGDGLKNDYGIILSNIANVVTIVAFIYGLMEKKTGGNVTINMVIEKFPNISKSKKLTELIEKILEVLRKRL